jgi:AraC-like DNA-binding protein
MSGQGAFGDRLGSRFRQEETRAIVARDLRKSEIAVTELRGDHHPVPFMSGEIPKEDAFLIALMIRDYPHLEVWEDGRQAPLAHLRAGETVLYDLKRDPRMLVDKPHHSVHFYLPRSALNAIADDANVPRIGELQYEVGVAVRDDAVKNLGHAMLGALDRPEQASRLFTDHVTLAVVAHVAHTYGGMRTAAQAAPGGLAPWQERRAKEILGANLDGEISLKGVALECGLSISHFSRAFRKSTGVAPHQWLVLRRIDAAKALLNDNTLSLSDVALRCGFADQSHFTRTFTRMTGSSPGSWRRLTQE